MPKSRLHEQERLRSRPRKTPVAGAAPVGVRVLESDAGATEDYLYVPAGYRTENPAPLVLLLHGAGEDARDGLAQLRGQADEAGIVLLACSSRGPTWDSILNRGRYGPDIASIDLALGDAFSPGFLAPTGQRGSPRIFVSHDTQDGWLPIDFCSRRIVPRVVRAGYEVRYREFEGGHVVPPWIARQAARWLTNRG
jgi:phospholipase/carboxylesterase